MEEGACFGGSIEPAAKHARACWVGVIMGDVMYASPMHHLDVKRSIQRVIHNPLLKRASRECRHLPGSQSQAIECFSVI